ncbi:MAG: NAD-dependent epimerase/dehydratase family protein [Agriterribacter sp.]
MRYILITGGAGNVGSSLSGLFVQDPNNFVVIVDDLSTGFIEKLPSKSKNNWKFIKADVNNFQEISAIMLHHSFDYVFHYAAVVGVQRTLNNPVAVLNDIDGIKNVLMLAKNTGVRRVFFSSSSEVYGEPFEIPQREDSTPLNSRLPYAIVKNLGEAYMRSYYKEYGLSYTIFRFFNTYGPNQSTDFVISKFIHAALSNHDITIYGDGMQTRTFCYIDDNISIAKIAIEKDLLINETINIGSNLEFTIVDLAKHVIELLGSKSQIVFLPPLQEGDMRRRCPDNKRMMEILGRDLTPLDEGIMLTAQAFKERKF